jgi:hypothetical protein
MRIAADEFRSLLGCQCEQVVVVGVGRMNRRRGRRIAGRTADRDSQAKVGFVWYRCLAA